MPCCATPAYSYTMYSLQVDNALGVSYVQLAVSQELAELDEVCFVSVVLAVHERKVRRLHGHVLSEAGNVGGDESGDA